MPRGRRANPRGVHAYDLLGAPLPEAVVLDTSFLVEALLAKQPLHAGANRYLGALARSGTVLVFNELLEFELAETAYQIALREKFPKDWRRRRYDGRVRRRATRLTQGTAEAWEQTLQAFDHVKYGIGEVAHLVRPLMRFGLASYDAIHGATAEFAGVPWIVTNDTSFGLLPEAVASILIDSGRLRDCRRNRA